MGWFSGKEIIQVATSITRVVPDANVPNSVKSGVIKAVFDNSGIPENIIEDLVAGIAIKADRMYSYGEKSYTHGMPSGEVYSDTQGQAETLAVLKTTLGSNLVLLDYYRYGPPNTLHAAWMKLILEYGYKSSTNQLNTLSAIKKYPVYLNNLTVVVPTTLFPKMALGSLDQWGTAASGGFTPNKTSNANLGYLIKHTPVKVDPVATEIYVRMEYTWNSTKDINPLTGDYVYIEYINLPITGFDNKADYVHAKYILNGEDGYMMYKCGIGTYPTIDAVFKTTPRVLGEFFPMVYFRYGKSPMNVDKTTEAYKTSKKLIKYIGMDYDTVIDAVHQNPDIKDVEQAMMWMAIPAKTENELEIRYLFDFFDALYYAEPYQLKSETLASVQQILDSPGYVEAPSVAKSAIVIQDTLFKMVLTNAGIYKKLVVGSLGAVGVYKSEFKKEVVAVPYQGTNPDGDVIMYYFDSEVGHHYYRKQITNNIYEELHVSNLEVTFHIYGDYNTIGNDIERSLYIPLDQSIVSAYSLTDREALYSRSLQYVFNSLVITQIAWYQSDNFLFLVRIVMVVIAVLSVGESVPATLAMFATMTPAQIALFIVMKLLIVAVGQYALKLFIKAVGVQAGMIIAIIALVAAAYLSIDAGSVKGAPWAQELLQLSSGISKSVNAELTDMYGDLLEEYQTFNLLKDEKTKELEASNKLLEHNNWLSPFVIFGEKPEDYYNRTVHSGNIGVLGIGAISNYVDIALTLPKLDETIEG